MKHSPDTRKTDMACETEQTAYLNALAAQNMWANLVVQAAAAANTANAAATAAQQNLTTAAASYQSAVTTAQLALTALNNCLGQGQKIQQSVPTTKTPRKARN